MTPAAGPPRLSIARLRKSYGPHLVLDDVELSAEPGTVVAVTGANGSGKSTLLRCVAGLARHQGAIEVDGQPVERMRHIIGYMPQSVGLPPWATVAEVIAYLARLRRLPETCPSLPEGFVPRGELPVKVLSGGQRQRVALAIAMLGNPSLLLLDEPASSLDDEGREALAGVLAATTRAGATVVIAAPSGVDPATPVDAVVTIRDGRLEQGLPPEQTREGPGGKSSRQRFRVVSP